ncbi:VanW family protein [Yinghuangia seranimata]|uniref:VanW family protein n=1 Tax=Yinghuangia seranimata TaxID=408067 RepID=UPI00248D017C|nr:VanW family protein [Yinghuangia seranimata]MDI2128928.1 VanW family protein [Yinghuangia seranimata]
MSNDHPTTPSGLPESEEPHPYFDPPPRRRTEPGRDADPPDLSDLLPPRDPAEFDAWFDDEPVRPMPPVDVVPPTPSVPEYEYGYETPEPDREDDGGSGDGGGFGDDRAFGDDRGFGAGGGFDPAPSGDAAPLDPLTPFDSLDSVDPLDAREPLEPLAAPAGVASSTSSSASSDADRGATGLPAKAGRRSLIGAFGPPADLRTPMQSEGFTRGSSDGDGVDQTMTTRVSIKIPGSRPIPPVVLRGQAPLGLDEDGYDGVAGPGVDAAGIRGWDDIDDHEFGVDTPARGNAPVAAAARRGTGTAGTGRRRRRTPLIAAAAAVALVGGLYGASLAYAGGGVPRGTSVLGVDIGGQSRSEAVRTLESRLGDRAAGPFAVRIGDKDLALDPPNAGLILDARGTVDRAAQRSLNPFTSIPAMFGGSRDVKPRTVEDPAKLAAALDQLASDAGEHQREGGVSFEGGRATAIPPQVGRVLDTQAAVAVVRDAYLNTKGPVVLPTKQATPKVTQEEVDRAMREFAVPAMSGPVTLTAGKVSLKLEPATLAKYLSMVPDANGKLVPKIDTVGLQDALGNTFSAVGQKPVNATFKVDNGKVAVVPSKPGQGVSGETAAQALLGVLTKSSARTAAVTLGPVEPALTTAKAEALGITDVISTYTTNYPYAAYRLTNIHRAADLIDNGVVMPGETWSLNETVGERTAENGFAKGTIINNGRFQTDYGGGVSQVATTMFNAVFFAGLKDVQHKPHSFWIDRYPAGREATVAWPSLDLKWLNDSGKPVFIDTSYTDSTVTVTLLGTKKYDQIKSVSSAKYDPVQPKTVNDTSPGCVAQGPSAGFKIDVTRVFVQDGREVRREQFHTRYDAADNIVCGPGTPPASGAGASPPPPAGAND